MLKGTRARLDPSGTSCLSKTTSEKSQFTGDDSQARLTLVTRCISQKRFVTSLTSASLTHFDDSFVISSPWCGLRVTKLFQSKDLFYFSGRINILTSLSSEYNSRIMADLESKESPFDVTNPQLLNSEKWLANEIKQLEATSDQRLNASNPFVVRIDGVSFRNYTRGFAKPFDQRMTRAFIRTSADLLQRFNPSTVYYASDEISLVFDACPQLDRVEKHPREHMYSGRVQKLASVIASYAAAKFNRYINEEDWSDLQQDHVRQRLADHSAYFDGRAFSVPNSFAAMAAIYWRHRYDTMKNATSTYALSYYSPKQIFNKNSHELREMMHQEHHWDMFTDGPRNILYGTFLKKELFDLESVDRKTQQPVTVKRGRVRIGSFDLDQVLPSAEEKIQFILSKYWNDGQTAVNTIELPEWWLRYYRQTATVSDEHLEDE